jgi:hypothetical protein
MADFTVSPKVVCGVFTVPKDKDTDRLIIDARPTNAIFAEPEPVKLPTPDLLSRLEMCKSAPTFTAKVDLDNFYHRLRLPDWMRPYFALPPVRAGDIGGDVEARYGSEVMVYPCCTTLPMGFSHSVLLAQLAHEYILDTRTSLRVADRITTTTDGRVDRVRHQVYIDDLILFGTDEGLVRAKQLEYIEAVERIGFVVKRSKVCLPSRFGVECLGLEVDGTNHTVGVSVPKLDQLRCDTFALLNSGRCTGEDMAIIVGRWTWACLAFRPALAIFNAVYRFIQCAGVRYFRIWSSVASELRVMIGLAPLLFTSVVSEWVSRVVAVDASSTGMGVVASPVGSIPEFAGSALTADEVHGLVIDNAWSTIVSSPWKRSEHINVLELRSLCTAVRWLLSRKDPGRRAMIFSDSQVVIGAVSKGRSSSQRLLRRIRHLSALLLASGFQLRLHYVRSVDNPADGPSRGL